MVFLPPEHSLASSVGFAGNPHTAQPGAECKPANREMQQGSPAESLSSGRARDFKRCANKSVCAYYISVGWAPLHLIPGCCISGGSGSTCRSKEKATVSSLCSLPQVPATSLVSAHVNQFIEKLILWRRKGKKKSPLVHLVPG